MRQFVTAQFWEIIMDKYQFRVDDTKRGKALVYTVPATGDSFICTYCEFPHVLRALRTFVANSIKREVTSNTGVFPTRSLLEKIDFFFPGMPTASELVVQQDNGYCCSL